jgi:hypothetical protein
MKSKVLLTVLTVFSVILDCAPGAAAPMRPLGPLDIVGTVVEAKWSPKETKKAIPGMSGSAGVDRVVPAHFLIQLKDYESKDAETARTINGYMRPGGNQAPEGQGKPPILWIQVNSDQNDLLKKGMKIKLINYSVSGDEGGIWTKHEKLEILQSQTP